MSVTTVSLTRFIVATDNVPQVNRAGPPVLSEMQRRPMAKANLRKTAITAKTTAGRLAIGRAIQRAMTLCGWSLKEFAAAVGRDPRQCARWMDGTERPQLDIVFAVPALHQPVIQAFAELAGAGVEVTTQITLRRIA